MSLSKIANGIPLHEAAAYFLSLKTAADPLGGLEGQFAAPVEEVLAQMAEHVQSEMKTQYAYLVYAQSLRDLSHFAIAEELEEHAAHEVEHAEFLLRRMSVLGGDVAVPDIPAPPPSSDPVTILKTLIQLEQEGIAHWQQLRSLVGEENPTRFKIEEYLATEQEHLDELWQMLPHGEASAAAGTPPAALDPQAAPPAAEAPVAPPAPPPAPAAPPMEAKTASARVEHFHPDTMKYHGSAMKLALATMRPTVFIPAEPEEEKTAAKKSADGLPDVAMGKMPPMSPAAPLSGPAAGQNAKMAEALKKAFSEMPIAKTPAPGGEEEAELEQYLQQEGQGMQEQGVAEDGHYRERFTDAMTRLQAAESQAQEAQAQVAELQQQVDMNSQANQSAMQQAQMIQDSAMQQVNAANTAASAAMQKSLASSNELLQQQQLATNMRDAVQMLKTQLMTIVNTQLPPSTTMEAGMSAQADQAAADQQAQEQALLGQDPNQPQQPGGAPPAPGGPPGAAPGAPPVGPSPTATDPSSSPTAKKEESSESSSSGPPEKSDETKEKEANDRFMGALAGGAIGAGVTGIEAAGAPERNNKLRGNLERLESEEAGGGGGGFGNAMSIAQAKMRLAMGELMEKHPGKMSLVGAGLGAAAGANAGPLVRQLSTNLRG